MGQPDAGHPQSALSFQYPLADRLGFWGGELAAGQVIVPGFSILWRIDLVFGENHDLIARWWAFMFQYPLADRLGFWGWSGPWGRGR